MQTHRPRGAANALATLLLLPACTSTDTTPADATAVRIPFTLTATNHLAIRATWNGSDAVTLMFHSAIDSVSLTTAAIARLHAFHTDTTANVHSWGGTTQARRSTGNTLQVGPLTFRDITATEAMQSGADTDGKFGPNLFADSVVEINFDTCELVLHPSLPALGPDYERLPLVEADGSLFVRGDVTVGDRTEATDFLLHTGFGGTALLDEQFVRDRGLTDALVTLREQTLTDSFGNPVTTRTVRLPALQVGRMTFRDVPAALFDGALGGRRTSVLGGGLLQRCNLVLDRAHGQVFVAPSRLADVPFPQ